MGLSTTSTGSSSSPLRTSITRRLSLLLALDRGSLN